MLNYTAAQTSGEGIDVGTTVAVASLIVTVAAVLVTIWATRRWGNRRAKVTTLSTSVPLLPESGSPLLTVTYRDFPVDDPHLVTVLIANAGPRDVASDMFDGGNPITVGFGTTFYGLTERSPNLRLISSAIGTDGNRTHVEIPPALLKRKQVWTLSAIVSGPAAVTLDAPLVDTDVVMGEDPRSVRATLRSSLGEVGLGVVSSVIGMRR